MERSTDDRDGSDPAMGKIDQSMFEDVIAPNLGAEREDVHLGPAHGCDFGVIRAGTGGPPGTTSDRSFVLATDPISILPDLGFERAGRFAIEFVLADVAVSGIAPSHLSIAFSLPPGMTDAEFAAVWCGVHETCAELGVAVTTGHTARYPGCAFPWVGAATAIGIGDPETIVRSDGAEVGDRVIVTRGPAIEATGLFAVLFGDRIDLPPESLQAARERFDDVGVVRDALAIAEGEGVHAIHDVTEGGLLGAFHEMAAAAGVAFRIDRDSVPVLPGVEPLCAELGMDPWRATSSGTLLAAVDPNAVDDVLERLDDRNTPAAAVGEVVEGSDVVVDDVATEPPTGDSSWPVYERLARET